MLALCLCALATTAQAQDDSCKADNLNFVRGEKLCLAITTLGGEQAGAAPVMIVWLHGDGTSGGPTDYLYRYAKRYASPGVVNVAMLRPEYFDSDGKKSTGLNYSRRDSYTEVNVAAVTAAVGALRDHHKARKVVLVGHSGGAAISGVIMGKYPGTADAALLVSCPCNIPVWRQYGTNWSRSLSPHRYAEAIPSTARVTAITGGKDTNTSSSLARDYIESLAKRGVKAEFHEISGASHNWNSLLIGADFDASLKSLIQFE